MKKLSKLLSIVLLIALFINTISVKVIAQPLKSGNIPKPIVKADENTKRSEGKIIGEIKDKREKNIKHFIKDDLTYEAAIYPFPVHYYENDEWKEIDNTLVNKKGKNNNDVLENKQNSYKVKLAKNTNSNKLVIITKDKYEVSWNIDQALMAKAEVRARDTDLMNSLSENERKKALININSIVDFIEVYQNVDFQYVILPESVKENIIIKERLDNYIFKLNISVKKLVPELLEDNSIVFRDIETNEQVFIMDAPFMYDANSEISNDVQVTLEENNKDYILTMIPNREWLNSEDRIYPITIDPSLSTSLDKSKIYDTHVSENYPTDNFGQNVFLKVGKGSISGKNRTYISFDLPTLTSADLVTYAELDLSLYSNQLGSRQINAHKVLNDWNESILTWDSQPNYNTIIDDYKIINGVAGNNFKWDVTNIVKEWFTTGDNYGLMLKNQDESFGYTEFFSSDTSSAYEAYRPIISLFYVNNTGIESYWTYHSQDIGRAGTAYVNDYNGNYIFMHSDINTNGNRMPVAISHFFNSNERVNNIGYGNGWRLSLYQTIVPQTINSIQYYVYTDEDGTKHYFKQTGSEYKDESGLDLQLVINGDNSYTLKDKKDNQLIFKTKDASQTRYLDTIKDDNNNTVTIGYNGTVIESVTDGAGKVIHLNYVNGLLDNIIDPAGRTTSYYYENNTLKTITYPDGKQSSYDYTPSYNMTDATNFDGYSVNIQYYSVRPWRVSKITEKHIDGTGGQALDIEYGSNVTTFSDINGRKNIYQFNNFGNTISVRDDTGYAMFYKYGKDSNINKLELESKLQRTVINILKNHNAEFSTGWTFYDSDNSTGSISYTTEDKYIGKQSIKITKSNTLGYHTSMQSISVDKGKTYTFSGYIKTSNISNGNNKGAQFYIAYQDNTGAWKKVESQFINGTNDWERIELTFTLPANSVSNDVHPKMTLTEETGTVYFDSLQFEEGHIANRYNLIENGDFKYNTQFWINNSDTDSNDTVIALTDSNYPQNIDKNAFRINGDATKRKNVYQRIELSGKKDDVFTLGGWAKGESVSVDSSKAFMLDIGIERNDGTYQWQNIFFNDDYSDWQYSINRIIADSDYKSVTVYMIYHYNANTAYFDGLQLYKEKFAQSYQYDDKGNLISTEDLAKQKSTFNYDTNSDLINSIDPKGNNYTYDYYDNHNMKTATSAENIVYKFNYDGYGNPNKVIIGSVNNLLDNHNFETNAIWTSYNSGDSIGSVDYDSNESYLGNQSYKIAKSNDVGYHTVMQSINLEKGKTYTFSGYIKADNLITNNNKGAQIYVSYQDSSGAWVKGESTYITDTNGAWQRLSFNFTLPSNSVSNRVDSKFTIVDASGTVYLDSLQIEEGNTATEYSKYLESYSTYTTNGNYIKTIKDSTGNVVTYNWNEIKGVLDNLVDAKNTTTTYQYDPKLDRLETVSKVVGGNAITNSYSYENDRIKTITHNGFSYIFGYDKLGNSTTIDVGNQNLITNNYEAYTSKLLNSVYGNNQKISYDYDNLDRVTVVKYNEQPRYKYEYDASGNIGYHEDLVNGTNYRYIYDLSDRLAKVVDSNGDSVSFDYDLNNNTSKLIDKVGNNTYTTSYGYDKDNKSTLVTMPDGNTINYIYDSLGRIESSKVNIGSPVFTTNYDYYKGIEGSETTKVKAVNNNGNSISYTYANGNIETITDNGQVIKYYYNELNELLREDNQKLNKTIIYPYDEGGNIQSKVEYPYTTEVNPSNPTKTYAYEYADTNWKDKLTSFDGKAITYDEIGNPLTYDGWNFAWEQGRQLQYLGNAQYNITFKYNDKGIRTEKTVNGVTTKYHLVGDQVTYETNGTDNIYYTYDNSKSLVSMNLNGVEYYYIKNGQGDIVGLFDNTGTEVASYTYDSWGKVISIDGSLKGTVGIKNPYRYRGYMYDTESGLYYLQSRYYNPDWSRFLNADGVLGASTELLSYNMFVYCRNNPINMLDDSGNWPSWNQIFKAAATVVIGAAVVVAVVASAGTVAAAAGIAAAGLGATGAMVSGVMTAATIGTYAVAAGVAASTLSNAGEQLTGTNFIRDKALGGNQRAYDAIQTGLTIASGGIIAVGATKPGYSGRAAKPSKGAKEMHSVPRHSTSISKVEKLYKNKPGQFQRRYYDFKGNVSLDIDFTAHSNATQHTNPHLHVWDNGRNYQINLGRR